MVSRPLLTLASCAISPARSRVGVTAEASGACSASVVVEGPAGSVLGSRTDPSSARLVRVMLPLWLVIDMTSSSKERPWPVRRGQGPRPAVCRCPDGPTRSVRVAHGQVKLTGRTGSGAQPPGRADRPTCRTRLGRQCGGQLPSQTADAAFEVVDGELGVDGLLEANDWVAVRNNGRTGRDRC